LFIFLFEIEDVLGVLLIIRQGLPSSFFHSHFSKLKTSIVEKISRKIPINIFFILAPHFYKPKALVNNNADANFSL